MLDRVKTIARIMMIGSVISFFVLSSLFGMPVIQEIDVYDDLQREGLTVIEYLAAATWQGLTYMAIGFIPTLLGLGLLIFYIRQAFGVSKRAKALWSASGLFNAFGLAPAGLLSGDLMIVSRVMSTILLMWIITAIFLSAYALRLIGVERIREQQIVIMNP
ncbi:MAG: hypothetical protein AAF267_19605 [Deinococcota bacterium]